MNDIIIQAIGFVAVLFFIISYQLRSNRALFLCQLSGCLIFCFQMCLLGAYSGAVGLVVNILRNLLLLKVDDWAWVKSKVTLSLVLGLLLAVTAFTWAGPISLLPLLSVGITTIGYWTNNAQKIRLSQLFGSPCTLLYDALVGTWGGVLSESIALVSILVSTARFGWKGLAENMAESAETA